MKNSHDDHLLAEMRRVSRLMAFVATRELEQRDAALLLVRSGFSPTEVAEFLGTTRNAVNLLLHRARKAGKKRRVRAP
jgi:DNA-directed RNA polymerase specialized sigma24 family protein